MADFDLAFSKLISDSEGTEVFIDRATGEVSKFGVTLKLASDLHFCEPGDETFIRTLTLEAAKTFYFDVFWQPLMLSGLKDQGVATKLFDMSVNMGQKQAVTLLQRALNELGGRLSPDGKMGPFTLAAINTVSEPWQLLMELRAVSLSFYSHLVDTRPEFAKYWENWKARSQR